METTPSFLARHEFLILRLHSLSGLIPVGAYMCIHLLTNATTLDSAAIYQQAVYQIHSLGALLPLIEWVFIFIPILFHGIIGVVIIRGGLPNYGSYKYAKNLRYTLQRATGMIAFAFIMWHVFHMRGWFHFDAWQEGITKPLGGAQFAPYNAASSLGAAMRGVAVPMLYTIGVLASVFHLANGIWTMGITWGVWTSPAAQKRADRVCAVFGIALAFVGLGGIGGAARIGNSETLHKEAVEVEDKLWNAKTASGVVDPEQGLHKRSPHDAGHAASE